MEPKVQEWAGIWDGKGKAVDFELPEDISDKTTMFVSTGCICFQVSYPRARYVDRFMLTEKQFRQIVQILREHGVEV